MKSSITTLFSILIDVRVVVTPERLEKLVAPHCRHAGAALADIARARLRGAFDGCAAPTAEQDLMAGS
jgi:hypothetical protein